MKFGKEFASQLVPEWHEAYLNYNDLKGILKNILRIRKRNAPSVAMASTPKGSLKRRLTLYTAFSGLTRRQRGWPTNSNEDEVILIHEEEKEGSERLYQTMFLKSAEEGGELEALFFKKLDDEFNKGERRLEYEGGNRAEQTSSKTSIRGFMPPPLRTLDHVKINLAEPETPVSTVKGLLNGSTSELSFNKQELRKAEEQLSRAFKEFYTKLRLLKCYSFLNLLAFSKIMKKYDKVCSRNASKVYLKMVDNSYVGSSDEVNRLMERVEAAFIKHFSNGNHRKGINILRPTAKRERHRITFFLGLLTGCSIALMVALIIIIQARDILNYLNIEGRNDYMENTFPLYSLFGFITLQMLMYSVNIYFWRRFKINYSFIFGFKQGTELSYREVLLLSSGLSVLTWAAVLTNLDIGMDRRTKSFSVLIIITFWPFNIIYKSSRFFLIHCMFHCICAPLYKVTLAENIFADQLTSQVQAFRSLEFYVCYYISGNFRTRKNKCLDNKVYETFYFIVAIIPFWIRFLQCIRRFVLEERNAMHGLNGLKYMSTIFAVATRTVNELTFNRVVPWRILATASSGVATIMNTYWDIVIDWGLLQRDSRNPWLRDKLSVSNKMVFFVAMVLNVSLRLAWMQSVLGVAQTPFLHRRALTAVVACLEIIRRGIWNFFRLENEHLNNVGKYRAFKSVPLPFNYEDDQQHTAI